MTLRVSAGNINDKTVAIINIINEKIKKILSVCVLLKIVFFIIIVVYHKYVHFQIFLFGIFFSSLEESSEFSVFSSLYVIVTSYPLTVNGSLFFTLL